jgi:lipopolysaccharide biosynthesis regulator YciM
MPTTIAPKKYVVDALNEVLPELSKAYAKEGKGRQVGLFLQQSMVQYADEITLINILADVREELAPTSRCYENQIRSSRWKQ